MGEATSAVICWTRLVGTANEVAVVTDIVFLALNKMSFVSGSKAASSSARPRFMARVRARVRAIEAVL